MPVGIVPAQESPQENEDKDKKGSTKGTDVPPWFDTDDCNSRTTPYVFTDGSLTDEGKIRCRMWINVCGTIIERQKFVDAKGGCWDSKDISKPLICCDTWSKYETSPNSRWDPKKDADGDGIPNDQDDDPLGRKPKH